MTTNEVQHVLETVGRYYPRSMLTPDEMQLFGERLCRIDITNEQADRIVEQHRMEHDKRSPSLPMLLTKMSAAAVKHVYATTGGNGGNRFIDWYRRKYKIPSTVSDLDAAKWVCRGAESKTGKPWSDGEKYDHLVTLASEFMTRDESRKIAAREYPGVVVHDPSKSQSAPSSPTR